MRVRRSNVAGICTKLVAPDMGINTCTLNKLKVSAFVISILYSKFAAGGEADCEGQCTLGKVLLLPMQISEGTE